jgi:hypothetical protein
MRDAAAVVEYWYVGEIGGEAMFWILAQNAEPDHARKWLALAQVESQVAGWLAGVIASRNHRDLPDCSATLACARARCDEVAGRSWPELMQWLEAIAADALIEMQSDAARLPAELIATGDLVVAHERALVEFAELEIAGRGTESLRPLREFIALVSGLAGRQHLLDDLVVQ